MKQLSVIIPFYQRERGLLSRTIQSVVSQTGVDTPIEIVIVDDGSPISAETETATVELPQRISINLVKQTNAGCYPACNTALDNISPQSDCIAFLDSDDVWFDSHIRNALWALDAGYDFYFSDFYQLNQNVSAFARRGRIDVEKFQRISDEYPVRDFSDSLFDQILSGNILGTSTIVYRRDSLGDLRYREDYRHTGAEYILWLNMAMRANRVAFSEEPECRYGGGVNIFSESSWGSEKYLTVRQDEMKYRKYVLRNMSVDSKQRRHLRMMIADARRNFCMGWIHNALHSRRLSLPILMKQLRSDPATLPSLIASPMVTLLKRFRKSGTGNLA